MKGGLIKSIHGKSFPTEARFRLLRACACHVRRGTMTGFQRGCELVALTDGAWAIHMASAGEIGCVVQGHVMREEGLSTRETSGKE